MEDISIFNLYQGTANIVIDVSAPLLYSEDPQETYYRESDWLLKKDPPGKFYHAEG